MAFETDAFFAGKMAAGSGQARAPRINKWFTDQMTSNGDYDEAIAQEWFDGYDSVSGVQDIWNGSF